MLKKGMFILLAFLVAPALWSDYVELKNGDRITGHIVSMNENSIKFKTSYGIIDIPRLEIIRGEFGDTSAVIAATAAVGIQPTAAPQKRTNISIIPSGGIVLECLFDGNFKDTSGNNHSIKKVNNIFFISGSDLRPNTAVLSDGTGTYLEIANSTKLQMPDSLTLSCWFYIQAEAGIQYLLSKWEKTTGQQADGKFALSYGKGNLYFYIVDENGNFQGIKQEAAITLQTWYHIAATFGNGRMRLYLNGEKLTEKAVTAKGLNKDTNPLYLMTAKSFAEEGWAYYNLSGRLDNARIYNRELTPAEVQLLFEEAGTL